MKLDLVHVTNTERAQNNIYIKKKNGFYRVNKQFFVLWIAHSRDSSFSLSDTNDGSLKTAVLCDVLLLHFHCFHHVKDWSCSGAS